MSDDPNLLPAGTLCLRCGYDLGGLAVGGTDGRGGVCPECGRRVSELDARRGLLLPAYLKRCRLRLAWWIALWLLIVIAFVVLGMRTVWADSLAVTTALLLAAMVGFLLVANGFWRGARGSRAFYRAYWLDNLWMLLLPLVGLEIAAGGVWLSGRWGDSSWLTMGCWAALVVGMPNVFLWRLHVLQMRVGVADAFPASGYVAGALLTIFVSVLGIVVLPF